MTDQIVFTYRKDRWKENSQVSVTARFLADAAAVTPTNVHYRLDCLTTGTKLADWTSATPGETVDITITPTQNAMQSDCNVLERKQLTVAADYGLSTEFRESWVYEIENIKTF